MEKLIVSKLLVEGSNRRIYNIDRHAGMVRSWMLESLPRQLRAVACSEVVECMILLLTVA